MRIEFEGIEEDLKKLKEYIEKGFEEVKKELKFINLDVLNVYYRFEINGKRMVFETNYFDVFKGIASSNKIMKFFIGGLYDKAKKTFVDKLKHKISEMKLNVNIVKTEL